MSPRPTSSQARATIASPSPSSPTSPKSAIARPPRSVIRSTTCAASSPLPTPLTPLPRSFTTTAAPWPASSSTCPRPMPCPAPVTTATFPSSSFGIWFLLWLSGTEDGSGHAVRDDLRLAAQRHADAEAVRLAADDRRHQPRPFLQVHDGRDVRPSVTERPDILQGDRRVGIERRAARRLDRGDILAPAVGADHAGVMVDAAA